MKLPLITLKQYILDNSIYKSICLTRKDGTELLLAKTNKGIVIVNTNCGVNYTKYILPLNYGMETLH